jgi:hypothetical protein
LCYNYFVQPEEKSKIDELKKSLYSRESPDVRTRRKLRFTDREIALPKDWGQPQEEKIEPVLNTQYQDSSMSFFTKILLGSIIFCVIAVGIGAFVFLRGANFISANNIDINISGPVSVPGGEAVTFDITVQNKNNVDLMLADMSVEFPAGATNAEDPSLELTTFRELIGDIPAGGKVNKTVRAIIFGEENSQKNINVTVNYKVKGSTSLFTKEKGYDLVINSSPINLTVDTFKEITSGQEFDTKVTLKSNSKETLKNVLLVASYPFGYTYISSDMKPLTDKVTWKVGDIPAGGEKTIVIKGRLEGEEDDSRVLRFAVGAQSSRNPNTIGTEYMSASSEIAIQKPFASISISIDNNTSDEFAIGSFNKPKRIDIRWFNNLNTPISNAVITAKLSGTAYDKLLVQPELGFFRSAQDEIVWDQKTVPELKSIGAGDSGRISFSVTPRDMSTNQKPIVNPEVNIKVGISGKRTQESGVPESLSSIASRSMRVSSDVVLSGRVVRSIGPFANTGPVPPKAEQLTTYTVIWTVDNSANPVSGVTVTSSLPPYVKWLGKTSPSSEDITYNENTGEISWNVGVVNTNTVMYNRKREVAFQIGFEPSITQVGANQTIINESELTAVDDFTGATLTSRQGYLTSNFSTDPAYKDGQGVVQQ